MPNEKGKCLTSDAVARLGECSRRGLLSEELPASPAFPLRPYPMRRSQAGSSPSPRRWRWRLRRGVPAAVNAGWRRPVPSARRAQHPASVVGGSAAMICARNLSCTGVPSERKLRLRARGAPDAPAAERGRRAALHPKRKLSMMGGCTLRVREFLASRTDCAKWLAPSKNRSPKGRGWRLYGPRTAMGSRCACAPSAAM